MPYDNPNVNFEGVSTNIYNLNKYMYGWCQFIYHRAAYVDLSTKSMVFGDTQESFISETKAINDHDNDFGIPIKMYSMFVATIN